MITNEQHREIEARLERNRKSRAQTAAYDFGFDAGKHGATEINAHYRLFSTKEKAAEWQRGYKDAKPEAFKEPKGDPGFARVNDGYGGTLARKAQEGKEREQKNCDHFFFDSPNCKKCGWVPTHDSFGVEDEIRDLHKPIIEHCRYRGWIYFYSNPRRKTGRTLGEVDFTCLLPCGVVIFVECKARANDLGPHQKVMFRRMQELGHEMHIVRTFDEFLSVCQVAMKAKQSEG